MNNSSLRIQLHITIIFLILFVSSAIVGIMVLAIPRADFIGGISRNLFQSIALVVVFIILTLIIGLSVIEHMLRDIRHITQVAKKMGQGEPLPRPHNYRKDEIGHLVKTFIEMENKLRFDCLTHIYNRDFLIAQIEFLERHAAQHPSKKVSFTLLFLDLDKFKTINDSYGHAAGDQLLIVIAARLKAAVRETDTVARFGGDEFVVLLNGASNNIDIETTVDKIHALVEQPIALSNTIVSVRVSIGWATFPLDASNYPKLVEIADKRMFSSKKSRNDVHLRLVE
ncbi:GGDEF domain-containing protein [Solimicrobium silvestre]|uniref:GGDEF: diguanylate cyclase (GGDEF) domain n=1 Tax=Solimicrobium silvestre TaxID=2099400 RepID=A0A2S9H2G3_9BURK|nr:GGDEF domain-containing protein [Solimicrobium silvestre]PRC94169.1 GGDEF: diguanylate cyclase (GGDEF) domain [Solimicrobium silvestre]